MRAILALLATMIAGCAIAPPQLDIKAHRIVDLTWAFDSQTLYWPGSPSGFELKRLSYGPTSAGFFYSANSFCAPEHGGTHIDAPIHFAEGRLTLEHVPLEQLIAPAVVIDVTAKCAADPDYRLTGADVLQWEARNGTIARGSIVLLRTGWSRFWPDRNAYFGGDSAQALHFPSYGADAARLLVQERGVAALGIDTASIDHGPSRDFAVHRIASAANVPGLENLANLGALPERGAMVIALPMKITGGSGAPLRIVALLPK